MGWESRGRSGKLYLYRSRRTADGRVVKDYVGCGGRAERLAAEEERRRLADANDRTAVETEAARLAEVEAITARVGDTAAVLTAAVLTAGGWHRVNYGPWRRRRNERGRDAVGGAGGRDPGGQLPGPGA